MGETVNIPRAAQTKRRTRIQAEKEVLILEAALEVFASFGFRGATIDQIAEQAGMSKPNLLYYFPTKEAIHLLLLDQILETWLDPLKAINPKGEPLAEIQSYIRRKLEMARDYPRESRLFANEILQGGPRIQNELLDLKNLVDEKVDVFKGWIKAGKMKKVDPYHMIFSIWATTQHYADFDVQVQAILSGKRSGQGRFDDAARYLDQLFVGGLKV